MMQAASSEVKVTDKHAYSHTLKFVFENLYFLSFSNLFNLNIVMFMTLFYDSI